jgi:CBS domain-containing protein
MPFSRAGQLARFVPTARLTDSLGLVAENLRSAPHGVLPVLDRPTFGEGDPSERAARVLGLIDSRDLGRVSSMIGEPVHASSDGSVAFSSGAFGSNGSVAVAAPVSTPISSGESKNFANLTARDVMNADVPHIPAIFSLHNALSTLDRYDFSALPVIDEKGRYCGVLSRADVLAALGNQVRPPMVGGMATPLGVWLTNGTLTGGAPPLGLFLSGLTLSACFIFAFVTLTAALWAINPSWGAAALSGRIGIALDGSGMLNTLAFGAHSLLFLVALRALPMAGIHAAEHQTVWAMEKGLPLEIEYVEKMPRAHPRCGTNLMALAGLITIGIVHLPDVSPNWVLFLLVFTFFAWRSFGTLLQEWFTTRPASKKQLQSGIKAARELIEKYQAQPFAMASTPLRLLNNGLLFSALGMMTGTSLFLWLLDFVASRLLG